ncbi:CwfJ C-terminus 1-domain-containing protein-like protein [Xylariomycetidae sp. FL0641]|nr:CwfJ C-terminus 1-domain-containing protein-like protein [Xylariomycetidae sp. FL0641]
MAAKVVVIGSLDLLADPQPAFEKLAKLHAKQNFAFAMIAGDIFSYEPDPDVVDKLLRGDIRVPLTTYFTIGGKPIPEAIKERLATGQDICENLHFLGKRSVTKTSDGIKIVSLGGRPSRNASDLSKEPFFHTHHPEDVKALRGANDADILLTTAWPTDVWKESKVHLEDEDIHELPFSDELADLVTHLKPRYHFAPTLDKFFWEREPFSHPPSGPDDVGPRRATRFIGLAQYGNNMNQKGLYAFSINPKEIPTSLPPGCTRCPLIRLPQARKRQREREDEEAAEKERIRRRPRKWATYEEPQPGPDMCYFCLSNPIVSTHMVCSIGDHSYVTTAKGPLPPPGFFQDAGLSFPGHQLIIPLPHEPTLAAMGDDAEPTYKEMVRFKESMQAMVATQSNHKLGAVTWEISRHNNVHLQWQFLPVPIDLVRKGLVEAGLRVQAENQKFKHTFEAAPADFGFGQTHPDVGDFLRVWIWADDGEASITSQELILPLARDLRFDLQFARNVMGKLLGLDETRLGWRAVVQTQADEVRDVEAFKEAFKPYDFTLAD